MRYFAILLLITLALTALRCTPPAETTQKHAMVEPGDLYHSALGETVSIMEPDGTVGANLLFEEVVEDSRCPLDVQCVQAGEARIQMLLHDADDQTIRFETSIPGLRQHGVIPDEADQREASAYVFHFLRLDPYPTADGNAASEPVAIFMVRFFRR